MPRNDSELPHHKFGCLNKRGSLDLLQPVGFSPSKTCAALVARLMIRIGPTRMLQQKLAVSFFQRSTTDGVLILGAALRMSYIRIEVFSTCINLQSASYRHRIGCGISILWLFECFDASSVFVGLIWRGVARG